MHDNKCDSNLPLPRFLFPYFLLLFFLSLISSLFSLLSPGLPYLHYSRVKLKLHHPRSVRSSRKIISFLLDAGMLARWANVTCSWVLVSMVTRLILVVIFLTHVPGMTNTAHLIFFLFYFCLRAYARALQLSPDTSNLWHDLAVAYYYLGQVYECKDFLSSPDISLHFAFPPSVSLSPIHSPLRLPGRKGIRKSILWLPWMWVHLQQLFSSWTFTWHCRHCCKVINKGERSPLINLSLIPRPLPQLEVAWEWG